MAKISDIPAEHRSVASRMKHLETMPAEEARHRAAHVARLEEKTPLTGEGRALMQAHSSRILRSLPVAEYLAKLKHYHETANAMPGGGIDSPAHELRAAAAKLRGENQFPPGLVSACEERLLGKSPEYDCDLDAVLGIGQAEKDSTNLPELSGRTPIEKAVNEAMASLDRKTSGLRKEINAFKTELNAYKAQIAADYIRAKQPIPSGFLTSPEQHPSMPELRELEASAQKYRDMANGIGEAELSEHYMSQARDYEDKAARLRRAIEASI
jgi:hypothetical protein